MSNCTICKKEIEKGSFVSTDGGYAHNICYTEKNKPIDKKTFAAVLINSEDQFLVRQLLTDIVPLEIQEKIIERFNEEIQSKHQSKIKIYKEGLSFV